MHWAINMRFQPKMFSSHFPYLFELEISISFVDVPTKPLTNAYYFYATRHHQTNGYTAAADEDNEDVIET